MLNRLQNAVRAEEQRLSATHPGRTSAPSAQATPWRLPTGRLLGTSATASGLSRPRPSRRAAQARRLRANPSHSAGDGPDQSERINIVSLNVTALEANWATCYHLQQRHQTTILALQETRHSRTNLPTYTRNAASPE